MLRGVSDDQLLKAKDVLKDELHPLRLELRALALMVADENDPKVVNNMIATKLTPLVSDYRRCFESRVSTLLTVAQKEAGDLYKGGITFAAAQFATGDPTLAALVGIATPFFDGTVKYVSERLKIQEKAKTHPFGFLQYLEKK